MSLLYTTLHPNIRTFFTLKFNLNGHYIPGQSGISPKKLALLSYQPVSGVHKAATRDKAVLLSIQQRPGTTVDAM